MTLLDMRLFGSKLFDGEDFLELIFRFSIDFLVAFIIIRLIYYPTHKRKDYLFTYFLFNLMIFFVCLLLNDVKLKLGFAFGLFALFGILRYRTETVPIKEMTYLFIVIVIAIINSLFNKKISIAELVFANGVIVFATYGLEKIWLVRHLTSKTIIYEKIDMVKKENRQQLLEDLRQRTGLDIKYVQIGKIDFLSDTAQIRIFFFEDEGINVDESVM